MPRSVLQRRIIQDCPVPTLFPRHLLTDTARALRHKLISAEGPQSTLLPLSKTPGQLNFSVGFGSALCCSIVAAGASVLDNCG